MPTFTLRDGQFWLDDKPLLIHAAEFHYFRTPRDEWEQRLGLLRDAGFNTVATYIPWLWHETEEGVTDLDGHSHPLRDLAGFLDLAAEMGFWLIPRPGPYIMAETINEGIPPWLFAASPQVAVINQREQPENIVSYLHPDFLARVERWYEAVFAVLTPRQITQGGRGLLIQLDNEMGMPHWVRNMFDINPDTLTRFAAYLEATYGSDLAARYPSDDLPTFLRGEIVAPTAAHGVAIVDDYRRFYRAYLRDYMVRLWEMARANGMDVPPLVNVHGFTNDRGGRTFPIGLSQLIEAIELPGMVTATDVYPMQIDEGNIHQLLFVNEATKAVQNPDQALTSIEFQAGGNCDFSGAQISLYDLHSRLSLSVGMRALNHYLFCDGENDPVLSPVRRHDWGHPVRKDGSTRRHYARYGRLSRVLGSYGEALVRAQPQTVTTVGFLLDNFMTEVNNAFTLPLAAHISHQRDVVLFDFIARGLTLTHRPFDAVELSRATLDPAQRPTLWAMVDKQCPAVVQQKLVAYAEAGGRLLLVGRLSEEDPDGTPATLLRSALGIEQVTSEEPMRETIISAFDYDHVPARFVESYQGDFDAVFARHPNGDAVGFTKAVGAGKVMFFGAGLPADTLDDLDIVHQMATAMGCEPLFSLSEWADVRLSRGEQGSFLYIASYRDDPIETTVTCDGKLLFDGAPMALPPWRGLILPLNWQVRDGVRLDYATGEVTGVHDEGDTLIITLEPPNVVAALILDGYDCGGETGRVTIQATDGKIVLRRLP